MMFGQYSLLVLLITVGAASGELIPPSASVMPVDVQQVSIIVEGDSIVLKCGYDTETVKYVVWYYSCEMVQETCSYDKVDRMVYAFNKEVSGTANGTNAWKDRAFGEEKKDGYYITLKNMQVADDDLYVCLISENIWGSNLKQSKSLQIEVTVEPSAGMLLGKDYLQTHVEKRSNFTCAVERVKPTDSASVVWYLGDKKLGSSRTPDYVQDNPDGKTSAVMFWLRRTFTAADDGKMLRCEVQWMVGDHVRKQISQDEGLLTVRYAPQWDADTHTVYAEIHSNVSMTCHVKSSPSPPSFSWFKSGFDAILHTGKTFSFQNVSKSNFTKYECEADNNIGPPKRFQVELQESGRPQLSKLRHLPNTTSTTISLTWTVVSYGGHPPLTITVSKRVKGHQTYKVMADMVVDARMEGEQINFHATSLSPNTVYEFQVQAKNNRKSLFPEKIDTGEELQVEGKTKVVPYVKITETKMEKDSLYVKWDFSDIIQELNRNYEVSLRLKYGKKGDFQRTHKLYPSDHSVLVTIGSLSIQDTFDTSADYAVEPVLYENDRQSGVTAPLVEVVKQSEVPVVLLAVLIPVVVLALIAIIVVVVMCRRGKSSLLRRKSTGHKRYNGDYMLERDIYEELKVKTKPPKLPSRNNSMNEPMSPVQQNNNITAIQTMYLTQYPRPTESGGGASGEIPPQTPTLPNDSQPAAGAGREGTDYLVPVNTSMQITVNQNTPMQHPPVEYHREKSLENITEEEKAEIEKLLPAPENHYLPMCKD